VDKVPADTGRDEAPEREGQRPERLHDNRKTPVPEQVAFRCDFPDWLSHRTDRDQQIILDMLQEESTSALARKYGVSSARISQLRREYHQDWRAFENTDT
jgi:hypothetical protein